ncbi:hypothetical protein ACJZ2D_006745 [Fusarium nematophilum]
MVESNFRVLIVGGSVAGLTLANMLEKLNVDFLVLEAYKDIAPQIGASIGLQANGLRILDQLGCSDKLVSLVDKPLKNTVVRDSDGSVIARFEGYLTEIAERHGYPTTFIDRQMLLQVLCGNLRNKDRVLTGKRVKTITNIGTYAEVVTESGETFRGDILIGADGIHSTVREEMWRIASEESPEYFHPDEWSRAPCDYKCIFGISRPTPALTDPSVQYVVNNNFSYLVITGPGGRIYWFLFVKLARTLYGDDVPRYTKADEATLAAEHASDRITPEITFGELYESRTSAVLTSLYEHAFDKWHYQRAFTVGDSAHKFEPISGQGGNSAIETAATLINHLFSTLQRRPEGLNSQDIHQLFHDAQEERSERVARLILAAHKQQQNDALETPLVALKARLLPRVLTNKINLQITKNIMIGAPRLNMLPAPDRPHSIPYNDELPARPANSWLPAGISVAAQLGLYSLANKTLPSLVMPDSFGGEPLLKKFVGIPALDGLLSKLVSAFGVVLTSAGQGPRVQLAYFLPVLFASALEWTAEGYRAGDNRSPVSWPSLFGAVYQVLGIARIAPLHSIASVAESKIGDSPTLSSVPQSVADALTPGLVAGFIVPSTLMMTPFEDKSVWQKFTALWQPYPVLVGILVSSISKSLRIQRQQIGKPESTAKKPKSHSRGTGSLKLVYDLSFGATTLIHLCSIYHIWSSRELSFAQVFFPSSSLLGGRSSLSMGEDIFNFFKWDLLFTAASNVVHGVYRIAELRSLGLISTQRALKAGLQFGLGQFIVGPAAAQIGLSRWREDVRARSGYNL